MFTQQISSKRTKFYNQIRQRQKQSIFRKIRAQFNNNIHHSNNNNNNVNMSAQQQQRRTLQSYNQIISNLKSMYLMSHNIQAIIDNQESIKKFINQIRYFQSQQCILVGKHFKNHKNQQNNNIIFNTNYQLQQQPPIFPFLQFIQHIISKIYLHINMDIEIIQSPQTLQQQKQYQQLCRNKQIPFKQIILSINFCITNIFANQQIKQFPSCIYPPILLITKHVSFIDCFYNIFLTKMNKNIKLQFLQQFIKHLKYNPILTLNNCHIYTKILYYAIESQPKLINYDKYQYQYKQNRQYYKHIIQIIDRINSTLSYLQCSEQMERDEQQIQKIKNQYKLYRNSILQRLCLADIQVCQKIYNCSYVIQEIVKQVKQFHQLFNININNNKSVNNQLKYQNEQYNKIQYLLVNLNILINMTSYDDVIKQINNQYPILWIYVYSMFNKLTIQYWQNNNNSNSNYIKLPSLFKLHKFPIFVQFIMKCMVNFVIVEDLCQIFITTNYNNSNNNNSNNNSNNNNNNNNSNYNSNNKTWIQKITELYNQYYKHQKIRVQCLTIFGNILLLITKNKLYFQDKTNNKYYDQDQNNNKQNEYIHYISNILTNSSDLLLQILKLKNNNKNIILSVFGILIYLIQQYNEIRNCQQFCNTSFINRIKYIANGQIQLCQQLCKGNKMEKYSHDVVMMAGRLLDLLHIQYQ